MALPLFSKMTGMPVNDVETRYKYFPAAFVWQGERVEVEAIRRFWTSSRRSLTGQQSELHHFSVIIGEGDFLLIRDLRRERWTLMANQVSGQQAA